MQCSRRAEAFCRRFHFCDTRDVVIQLTNPLFRCEPQVFQRKRQIDSELNCARRRGARRRVEEIIFAGFAHADSIALEGDPNVPQGSVFPAWLVFNAAIEEFSSEDLCGQWFSSRDVGVCALWLLGAWLIDRSRAMRSGSGAIKLGPIRT